MKQFLTIRNNILFVNLIVVGLILWLAISFLYLAATQNREAEQLTGSIKTAKVIFESISKLANERDTIGHILYSTAPSDKDHLKQVGNIKNLVTDSDAMLDTMYRQMREHLNDPEYLNHIPATRSSIETRLLALKDHRLQMNSVGSVLVESTRFSTAAHNSNIVDYVFKSYSFLNENLIALAESIEYLPDNSASPIAVYHALLNTIMLVNVDLTTKNPALRYQHFLDIPMSSHSGVHDALLSQRIEHGLARIVALAQASETAHLLSPIAEIAQSFYLTDYKNVEASVRTKRLSPEQLDLTHDAWKAVNSSLTTMIDDLKDAAHQSISLFADKSTRTAKRNFIIDIFLVLLCFAITAASVIISRKVKQYAYHDSLTQLSNRITIESALSTSSTTGSQIHAVIYIDLDRFKTINDNYGHSVGDELLIEISNRLKAVCNSSYVLARLGGDEFAVYVHNARSASELHTLAKHMLSEITSNIQIQDVSLRVGASAGICIAPMDCAGGIEMLKNADIAMYHSKRNKPGNICRFTREMAFDYQQRVQLELDLKKGLENKEFHLAYQPKICTQSGMVKSVEALLRWTPQERGSVSPAQFIPIAEDIGMMGSLGNWALFEACRETSELQKLLCRDLQVAVNISAQQFGDEQFIEHVKQALFENDLQRASLELEVTESIVMSDIDRVIGMLKYLQEIGIKIAVDDFGTGYSSLQYLQKLPLNTLKIDRAFIVALDQKDPLVSVANSIVQMARLFNLETVAEGVETEDQDTKIRSLGVHHIQGYRYSKPVSANELPAAINRIEAEFRQHLDSDSQKAA